MFRNLLQVLLALSTLAFGQASGLNPVTSVAPTFRITVDYGKSLAEMILAGHYDWTNSNITEKRFPVKGSGKVELDLELVHYDHNFSSDDAVKEMAKRGLRPATIEELLAFGVKYPEEQLKFPVVALGSSARVDGGRHVPFLSRDGAERDLNLGWWDGGWRGGYRFLAVRNY